MSIGVRMNEYVWEYEYGCVFISIGMIKYGELCQCVSMSCVSI